MICHSFPGLWSQRGRATEHPQLPPHHAWGRHAHCCSCSRYLATRWQHDTAVPRRRPSTIWLAEREQTVPVAKGCVSVPRYFSPRACQLDVLTEVVLFTVEWRITNESVRSVSNTEILVRIKGDYNTAWKSLPHVAALHFIEHIL